MKKESIKSDEKIDKKLSIESEIDALVRNAEEALKTYVDFNQEQVDKIVYAMALAGLEHHRELARLAVDETHRGVYEDKIIKNIFATEYIWNSIKNEKTVGIVENNEMEGYVEVAEPVGIVAGVTPVTNPTSTTMFKSLICAKARNPIIFGFHPSAQQSSLAAAKILRDAAVAARSSRGMYPMDRAPFCGCHHGFDESPEGVADPGYRRCRHGALRLQLRKTRPRRRTRQRALLH